MHKDYKRLDPDKELTVLSPEPLHPGERWSPPASQDMSPTEIEEMLARLRRVAQSLPTRAEASARVALSTTVHAPDRRKANGELDIGLIASALGMSDAALAEALAVYGKQLATNLEDQSHQVALRVFARTAVALRLLLPDDAERRTWLDWSRGGPTGRRWRCYCPATARA